MTQSNAELLRSGYEAFAAGDVPAVLALFDAGITWHISGRNPMSGDYTGHDEVVGFFQALGERSGGTFNLDVREILEDGEGLVMAYVIENAERDGARLSEAAIHVWRMRDGQATSFDAFLHDDHDWDDFWS